MADDFDWGESPAPTEQPGVGALDYAKTLGGGAATVGSNLAGLSRHYFETGASDEGKSISASLQGLFGALADKANDSRTEAAKKAATAALNSAEFWEHPILSTALKATGMVPSMAALAIPGGLLATAAGATATAAVGGAALNAGSVVDEFYKQLDALSDQDLQDQSPKYAAMREVMDEKLARARFAKDSLGWAPAINAVLGAATAAVGPAGMAARTLAGGAERAVIGGAERGVLGRAGLGAAEGASTNAVQEGVADYTGQQAGIEADLQQTYDPEKTVAAAMEGTAMGALFGGVAGGVSGVAKGGKRVDSPASEAPFTNKGMQITDPAAPDANPGGAPEAVDAATATVAPQPNTGRSGTPSKPVDDPAVVGNPQNAPATTKRDQLKAPKFKKDAPKVEVVEGAAPDAAQLVAIKAAGDAPVEATPTETAAVPQVEQAAAEPVQAPVAQAEPAPVPAAPIDAAPAADPAQAFAGDTPVRTEPVAIPQGEITQMVDATAPPAAPARTGRVLPSLTPEAQAAQKAQNAALAKNILSSEPVTPKGKKLTKAERERHDMDKKVAERVVAEHQPSENDINYAVDKTALTGVLQRAQRMVEQAQNEGIKIPEKIRKSVTGDLAADDPNVQALVYARDLVRAVKSGRSGKKLNDAIGTFLSRESDVRSGDADAALSARRSEGEAAMRRDQGSVEDRAAASTDDNPESILRAKEEVSADDVSAEASEGKADLEKNAVQTKVAGSARGPLRGVSDAAEERVVKNKEGKEVKVEAAQAASPVRKVTVSDELKAKYAAQLAAAQAKPSTPEVRFREAAQQVERNPTEAQITAGNYRKGHAKLQGMDIAIENPRGSFRRGVDEGGKPWAVRMPDHYGYIKRTEGADGDHIDTYIGKHPTSDRAFVIDQLDARTGQFDEHKVMLGYRTEEEARTAYGRAFSDGMGPARLGNIHELSVGELKSWLKTGDTTEPVTRMVYGDVLDVPDGYVQAEQTISAKDALKRLDFTHLDGTAGAISPFIQRRLMELVGDAQVHFVSDAQMLAAVGREGGAPFGLFRNWTGDEVGGEILINMKYRNNKKEVVQTILHEATHRVLDNEIRNNPSVVRDIKDMMEVTEKHVTERAPGFLPDIENAFKNPHEFMAEVMSNPDLQDILQTIRAPERLIAQLKLDQRKPSLWEAMKAIARKAVEKIVGPLPHTESLFDAAMKVSENLMLQRKMTLEENGVTVTRVRPEDVSKPQQFVDLQMRELTKTVTQQVQDMLARPDMQKVENAPLALSWRSFDNVAQISDHYFGKNNPIRKIQTAVEKTRVSAQAKLEKSAPAVQRLYELSVKDPKGFADLTSVLHDATIADIHPDKPLSDPIHAYLGKDALKGVQGKARHAELAKRYNELSPEMKEGYHQAVNFFTKQQNEMSFALLKNRMEAEGHTDPALISRVWNDKTTDADDAALGDLLPLLKDTKELSKINGPYVPLMRRGDHVVSASMEIKAPAGAKKIGDDTLEFKTRQEAVDFAKAEKHKANIRSVWVDKAGNTVATDSAGNPIRVHASDPDSTNVFRVQLQNKHVEFFPSLKDAQIAAAELEKAGLGVDYVGVRKPDRFGNEGWTPQNVISAIAQLKKRDAYKNATQSMKHDMEQAIRDSAMSMMGSTRIPSKHLPRRYVEGYNRKDFVQNTYDYAGSTSATLARLEHAPQLEAGIKEMDAAVRQDENKEKNHARQSIANDVTKRLEKVNEYVPETKFSAATKRMLEISFVDKLASPAYSVVNAMQPAMVTMPYLAGKHGVARSAVAMSRAYSDIGALKLAGKGVAATLRKFKAGEGGGDYIADIRANAAKTENERRMLDEHIAVGSIDPSAGMEITDLIRNRKGVGGKIDTGLSYLDGIAREMPRAVESINRAVTALAAYRLEIARGASHEAAVQYSVDTVNNTQFNYSNTNAPKIFNHPLAKLALQFKKYGQNIYQLIGTQIGRAMRNAEPGERAEALKTLATLAGTHAAMAGALGLPTEPFKYLIMGANAAGLTNATWGDVEHKIREGAASVVGKTAGEAITRGLPRLVNLDLSRVGLDSVTSFGEPRSNKEGDVKKWLFDSAAGPVVALAGDWTKGLNNVRAGEFSKAAEQLIPMKAAADSIRAYRQMTEGKKSAAGTQTMTPYTPTEAAMRALGFTPGREAEVGAQRAANYSAMNNDKDLRGELTAAWVKAKPQDKQKAFVAIQRYNSTQPKDNQITMKQLTAKAKRANDDDNRDGIRVTKSNKHLMSSAYATGG